MRELQPHCLWTNNLRHCLTNLRLIQRIMSSCMDRPRNLHISLTKPDLHQGEIKQLIGQYNLFKNVFFIPSYDHQFDILIFEKTKFLCFDS